MHMALKLYKKNIVKKLIKVNVYGCYSFSIRVRLAQLFEFCVSFNRGKNSLFLYARFSSFDFSNQWYAPGHKNYNVTMKLMSYMAQHMNYIKIVIHKQ